jgi:hypothetical protein
MHHIDFQANTISSNADQGVYVNGGLITFDGNTIDGNTQSGIEVDSAAGVTIGATAEGDGNTISTNGGGGIKLDATALTPALILHNTISGNTGPGILLLSSDNTIGGTAAGAANVITSNTGAGVALEADGPPTGNMISGNSISGNGALGIDLDYGGTYSGVPLPNDSAIANNNGQNYPVISSVVVTGAGATAAGTFNSTPSTMFTIEFFGNTTADSSGYGQGQTYLTSISVTTDGSGDATFTGVSLGLIAVGTHHAGHIGIRTRLDRQYVDHHGRHIIVTDERVWPGRYVHGHDHTGWRRQPIDR